MKWTDRARFSTPLALLIVVAGLAGCKAKPKGSADAGTDAGNGAILAVCLPNSCTSIAGRTICSVRGSSLNCACDPAYYTANGEACDPLTEAVASASGSAVDWSQSPPVFNAEIKVLDDIESPLANVSVTVGTLSATTDAQGRASLAAVPTTAPAIRVSLDGYAPVTAGITVANAGLKLLTLHLTKLQKLVALDSASGGLVSTAHASVDFRGGSFLTAAGVPYDGMASIGMAATESQDESAEYGTYPDGSTVSFSQGSGVYVLLTDAAGNPLTFAPDAPATVHLRLPATAEATEGDVYPAWTQDETTGLWSLTGGCTVSALDPATARATGSTWECLATARHFSKVAVQADRLPMGPPQKQPLLQTKLVSTPTKVSSLQTAVMKGVITQPVSDMKLASFNARSGQTAGQLCALGPCPNAEVVKLTAQDEGACLTANLVLTSPKVFKTKTEVRPLTAPGSWMHGGDNAGVQAGDTTLEPVSGSSYCGAVYYTGASLGADHPLVVGVRTHVQATNIKTGEITNYNQDDYFPAALPWVEPPTRIRDAIKNRTVSLIAGDSTVCTPITVTMMVGLANQCVDLDNDGWSVADGDCNDNDPTIYPGARQIPCDGIDHACSGVSQPKTIHPTDLPADQWNTRCRSLTCAVPGVEIPGNLYDEDCNGVISDEDNDGYLAVGDMFQGKNPATGAAYLPGDCNDRDATAHPGATEIWGNSIDENCDGLAVDQDNDHFPSADELLVVPANLQTAPDCDDNNAAVHPNATTSESTLRGFYVAGLDGTVHRTAAFCSLFDSHGAFTSEAAARYLRDFNCNGQSDDLDGDGWLPYPTPEHPDAWDCDDLDPRIFPQDGTMAHCTSAKPLVNDLACMPEPDLSTYGGPSSRRSCPYVPGKSTPSACVDLVDQNNVSWGLYVCQPLAYDFSNPLKPFAFKELYGPCDYGVKLPPCGAGLQCAGPMTYSAEYLAVLKAAPYNYDVASEEPNLGMCLSYCGGRCDPNPCTTAHQTSCTLVNRQPVCGCDAGYVLRGGSCVSVANPCQMGVTCQNGGVCSATAAGFLCTCAPGYQGAYCADLVNHCAGGPCQNGATCQQLAGSYACACARGWTGTNCDQDINECTGALARSCDPNATCTNSPGSFSCACKIGWVGNGSVCVLPLGAFVAPDPDSVESALESYGETYGTHALGSVFGSGNAVTALGYEGKVLVRNSMAAPDLFAVFAAAGGTRVEDGWQDTEGNQWLLPSGMSGNQVFVTIDGEPQQAVPLPFDSASKIQQVRLVRGSSKTDVWVAGSAGMPSGLSLSMTPVMFHSTDGTTFTKMNPPSPTESLSALWAISPTDVWAAGSVSGMLYHYNGMAWTMMAAPMWSGTVSLWASGSMDVWAVGPTGAIHWDGMGWRPVGPNGPANFAGAVSGTGPNDVWFAPAGASDLVYRWDGRAFNPLHLGVFAYWNGFYVSPGAAYLSTNEGTLYAVPHP